MSDDLFPRLRRMWERRDPVPPGLADSVLVALATVDLGAEYELLTLLESSDRLAGVRGGGETVTLTFAAGDFTVMLRVSVLGEGMLGAGLTDVGPTARSRRRIDGWVSAASALTVRLLCADGDERTTDSTAEGRFEFPDVPAGAASIWLEPRFATPRFDL